MKKIVGIALLASLGYIVMTAWARRRAAVLEVPTEGMRVGVSLTPEPPVRDVP